MLHSAAEYEEEGEGCSFLGAYAQISHVSLRIRHSKKAEFMNGSLILLILFAA